jgi:short-chain fatty acids transporter
MLSSLVSWTFSLIFSGLLAREVTHRVRGAVYRAVGAAAYLGVGGVWAFGLTSSAALIMATPASLPPAIMKISGVIPLSETLGLWQSMVVAATLVVVSVIIAYSSAPGRERARSMVEMGVTYEVAAEGAGRPQRPGEWLEYSPVLTVLMAAMGGVYLVREVASKGFSVLL